MVLTGEWGSIFPKKKKKDFPEKNWWKTVFFLGKIGKFRSSELPSRWRPPRGKQLLRRAHSFNNCFLTVIMDQKWSIFVRHIIRSRLVFFLLLLIFQPEYYNLLTVQFYFAVSQKLLWYLIFVLLIPFNHLQILKNLENIDNCHFKIYFSENLDGSMFRFFFFNYMVLIVILLGITDLKTLQQIMK